MSKINVFIRPNFFFRLKSHTDMFRVWRCAMCDVRCNLWLDAISQKI